MPLERRNPLPTGIYWVDMYEPPVGGASIQAFQQYLREHTGNIVVLKTVYHGPGPNPYMEFVRGINYTLNPLLAAIAEQVPDAGRARAWLLFQVKNPVLWPAVKFGYPTIAEKTTEEQDTVNRPDPEMNLADKIPTTDEMLAGSKKAVWIVGGVAAAALAVYVAVQSYFVRKVI